MVYNTSVMYKEIHPVTQSWLYIILVTNIMSFIIRHPHKYSIKCMAYNIDIGKPGNQARMLLHKVSRVNTTIKDWLQEQLLSWVISRTNARRNARILMLWLPMLFLAIEKSSGEFLHLGSFTFTGIRFPWVVLPIAFDHEKCGHGQYREVDENELEG